MVPQNSLQSRHFLRNEPCLTIALAAILKASRKWTRGETHHPLPWNQFLPRPNPLSVSLSKMAAYRIIHRSPRIFIAHPAKYACSAGYLKLQTEVFLQRFRLWEKSRS